MEIALSSELEKIIEYKIRSGAYQNASEFVREAILRAVEHDQLKLSELNAAISIGIEQAERGEFSDRSVQDIIKLKASGKKG
ncbi:type II toxin-antitoxin system ParD family antitoxin [candidate division KSB1 bacterium]|nr:type II toxin-antitoxin system ParD family antitoxin [candidate division KSB1 bacterium]